MSDDNDRTHFDEARRRDLKLFLERLDRFAAVLELRQEAHPLSADHLRQLAQLDRSRATVRDMLDGKLPLDTHIPVEEGE
jgi:hypothetical protein